MSLTVHNDLAFAEVPLNLVELKPVQVQEDVRDVVRHQAADLHTTSVDVGGERDPTLNLDRNLRAVSRPDLALRPLNLPVADKARWDECDLAPTLQQAEPSPTLDLCM